MKKISEKTQVMFNASDGTEIICEKIGSGPALVIVYGVGRTAYHCRALAAHLGETFTVYVLERRGRDVNSARDDTTYSLDMECDDVITVLKETGAEYICGYSYGGLIALEAAYKYPLKKVAVYDPGVTLTTSVPTDWLPSFEKAVVRHRPITANALILKGLGTGGPLSDAPLWLIKTVLGVMGLFGGESWKESKRVLPTVATEIRVLKASHGHGKVYANLETPTLITYGEQSPAFLQQAAHDLAAILPHAKLLGMPGLMHHSVEEPDSGIADVIKDFMIRK
jgi:pimeloyl-ACP methyl ester carboxylesterase